MSTLNIKTKTKTKTKTKNIWPIILGIIVLFSGHVAMGIFSHFYSGLNPKGFDYYNAATYGDAICLPLLVYSLGSYVGERKKIGFQGKIGFIIGCIVGIYIQITWLQGAPSNWTIEPRNEVDSVWKMYFTGAGWYHAVFFVLVLGIISGLLVAFVYQQYKRKRELLSVDPIKKGIYLSIFSFAGCLYTELHFADNCETRLYTEDYGSTLSVVFLGIMLVLFIIVILPTILLKDKVKDKTIIYKEFLAIATGCIFAVAISSTILLKINNKLLIICCAFAASALFQLSYKFQDTKLEKLDGFKTVIHFIVSIGVLTCISCIILNQSWSPFLIVWFTLLLYWPFLLLKCYPEYTEFYSVHDGKRLSIKGIYLLFIGLIVYIIGSTILKKNMVIIWNLLYKIDPYIIIIIGLVESFFLFIPIKKLDLEIDLTKRKKLVKTTQYFKIVITILLCYTWLIFEIQDKLKPLFTDIDATLMEYGQILLIMMLALLVFVFLALLKNTKTKYVVCFLILTFYVFMIYFIAKVAGFSLLDNLNIISFLNNSYKDTLLVVMYIVVCISLLFQIIGSSLFGLSSFYSNAYGVRGFDVANDKKLKYKLQTIICSLVICFGNIIVLYILGYSFIFKQYERINTMNVTFIVLLLIFLLCVLPVVVYKAICDDAPHYSYDIVNGEAWIEIGKDGLLVLAILILAAGLPLFMLKSLASVPNDLVLDSAAFLLTGMLTLYSALTICCKNNKKHFKDLIIRKISKKKDKTCIVVKPIEYKEVKLQQCNQLHNLYYHLRRGCIFGFVASIVYSVAFFILESLIELFKCILYKKSFKEYLGGFLPTKTDYNIFKDIFVKELEEMKRINGRI